MKAKKRTRLRNFFRNRVIDLEGNENCINRKPVDSLIITQFADGHIHHLLPSKASPQELLESLIDSEGLSLSGITHSPDKAAFVEQRPLIFKNRQALGDILMMTAGIRDFKKSFPNWPINVSTTAMHIWDHNPNLNRELSKDTEIAEIGPGFLTNASNRDDRHFANAFRISIEDKLGISIAQGPIKPDIWMTKDETDTPLIEPPYWIIVAGEKGDWTAKTYSFVRWQNIVNELSHIKFVQIGAKEHKHPALIGKNVINLIGKTQNRNTGIRDLFRLFYFAEGSMGLVSFQMHLAAAFHLPCVVIAGAREPARFTRYPGHQYLCTDGCLPCAAITSCWHCNLEKTCPEIVEDEEGKKIPRCVDIIKEDDVLRAFYQFYEGKRLNLNNPRKPILPNPIVEDKELQTKIFALSPEVVKKQKGLQPESFGFKWGGACITSLDWDFLASILEKYKINTVLEFGSGLSTALMAAHGRVVTSYETEERWIKDLTAKGISKLADIRIWNGKEVKEELKEFDLAIVDGPPGGESREFSSKIASEHSDIVLFHDAGRAGEKKWQDKYVKDKFSGPGKGGNRWHLWIKEEKVLPEKRSSIRIPSGDKKLFRLLFNGRGDGGAEHSTNLIMNQFIEKGWDVEYVHSSDSPSGTFRREGHPKVITTGDLGILRRPCDVLLLYVNDWVWEFNKESVVKALEASETSRKVMVVNFRLGEIGKIPWTQNWDKYLFLNSELDSAFKAKYMNSKSSVESYSLNCQVLPPPTDLRKYLKTEINYSGSMRIVRHSSQGNAKYALDFNQKVESILERFPESTIRLMPAPSFLEDFEDRVISHKRNDPSVDEFLSLGNVFWYDLPDGYHDMGPKVIMEAQASGLPIIGPNHSGSKDRVITGTGFVYDDFENSLGMFLDLNKPEVRRRMGKAAKDHAKKEYNPNNWIKAITGEENGNI